jgi:hypothetical protein
LVKNQPIAGRSPSKPQSDRRVIIAALQIAKPIRPVRTALPLLKRA